MTDIFSDFIECFHSPLDYVKGINTTGAVRSVFIYTLCDPFGTIAGYNLDAGQLLWSKLLIKLFKDGFAMAFRCPYNRVGIVINDYCNVLVTLFITGFVNADINQAIKSS